MDNSLNTTEIGDTIGRPHSYL